LTAEIGTLYFGLHFKKAGGCVTAAEVKTASMAASGRDEPQLFWCKRPVNGALLMFRKPLRFPFHGLDSDISQPKPSNASSR
jgi:hypothetical protein